jgi:hypothetical protein
MVFDPEGIDDLLAIQKIAKDLVGQIPKGLVGGGAGALLGLVFGPIGLAIGAITGGLIGYGADLQAEVGIPNVECPHCRVSFKYYSPNIKHFSCPACRQEIPLSSWEK